jgi:hypothetical protein
MPENPLDVDPFVRDTYEIQQVDNDGDGLADGLVLRTTWALRDLPFPAPESNSGNDFAGFDALGQREVTALETLAAIADEATVVVHSVHGHASGEGDDAGNLELSQLRAHAVGDVLDTLAAVPGRSLLFPPGLDVQGFGETEPEILAGENDHPLNRRVELDLEITRIAAPADRPGETPGRKWRIDYDQSFSIYRVFGAQVGVGTLARLDDAREPVETRHFWYVAGGLGIDGGRIAKAADKARQALASGTKLSAVDRTALWMENRRTQMLGRLEGLVPAQIRTQIEKLRKGWQDALDQLGVTIPPKPAEGTTTAAIEAMKEWRGEVAKAVTLQILQQLGIDSVADHEFLDGDFETAVPRTMSEIEASIQALLQVQISTLSLGAGLAAGVTVVFLFIPGADPPIEVAVAVIAEVAADYALVPAGGEASGSANSSWFRFRERP